jgi:hypothetical protein
VLPVAGQVGERVRLPMVEVGVELGRQDGECGRERSKTTSLGGEAA